MAKARPDGVAMGHGHRASGRRGVRHGRGGGQRLWGGARRAAGARQQQGKCARRRVADAPNRQLPAHLRSHRPRARPQLHGTGGQLHAGLRGRCAGAAESRKAQLRRQQHAHDRECDPLGPDARFVCGAGRAAGGHALWRLERARAVQAIHALGLDRRGADGAGCGRGGGGTALSVKKAATACRTSATSYQNHRNHGYCCNRCTS